MVNTDNYTLVGKNYPNPFNATTIIPLILANNTYVNLGIYDMNGNLVITLVDSEMSSGMKEITGMEKIIIIKMLEQVYIFTG